MRISYDKLFRLLEERRIKRHKLIEDGIISGTTYSRLKTGNTVNLQTLDMLSIYLGCGIWDIFSIEL